MCSSDLTVSIVAASIYVPTNSARENHNSKRVMYHNVHRSSIYNSQDMEAKKKKVHNQMNGQRRSGIWTYWKISHTHIKRNGIELFVVRWMDVESVIQSEVSQKEKNKYRMLTHIYGI